MNILELRILLLAFFVSVASSQYYGSHGFNNQLMLNSHEVAEVKKAQVYLEKELDLYSRKKSDSYTLFLAVKNYADRLYRIQTNTLNGLGQQLQRRYGGSYIGKIFVGSKSRNTFSFAKETSLDS